MFFSDNFILILSVSLIVTIFTNDIAFVYGESIQFMPTINVKYLDRIA